MAARNHLAEAQGIGQRGQDLSDIHETAVISPGAQIGDGVRVGPYSVVGPDVVLGDGVVLHNGVTIGGRTRLGAGCEVFTGAVIGMAPQILGFKDFPESRVEIGARSVIREHVTIHPGSEAYGGLTSVGEECLLMVGVHIAHDCRVAEKCVFANQVALGGNVHVEEQVWIGGLAAVVQHCRIGRHAFASGGAMIGGSVIPYGFVLGNRAHLVGLNVIGMKRRGFSRDQIHALRGAYRMLFANEGSFSERIVDTQEAYAGSAEVAHILDFIATYKTPALTVPE